MKEVLSKTQLIEQAEEYIRIGRLYYGKDREGILRDYGEVCLDTQLSIAGICNLEFVAQYVIENDLEGAFVECGTWRGGAIGYWARSYLRNGGNPMKCPLYGFDSFQGMPRMTIEDGEEGSRWLYNKPLAEIDSQLLNGELISIGVNVAPEDICRELVASSGYHKESIGIVKGWFQDTLLAYRSQIGPISVLRLDADLYKATKFCLDTLHESVIEGGVVIIDDYGCFEGCRKAVDEFISGAGLMVKPVYIDYSSRFYFWS